MLLIIRVASQYLTPHIEIVAISECSHNFPTCGYILKESWKHVELLVGPISPSMLYAVGLAPLDTTRLVRKLRPADHLH